MAVFAIRTEELQRGDVCNLFVETEVDRKAIDEIKGENPTVLEGSRGTGKSFLMKVAEAEMSRDFAEERVLPVYISFKKSSLVQVEMDNKFLYWMISKICSQIVRAFREKGLLQPAPNSLGLVAGGFSGEADNITQVAKKFEESWKRPKQSIDISDVPDTDDLVDAVSDICGESNIRRICLLFDEAAHVFRIKQQHAFFTLFRDLRSPFITCNAAVYPGVTSYGPSFEMGHDATRLRLERSVFDSDYVGMMQEIVSKQVSRKVLHGTGADKEQAERLSRQIEPQNGVFRQNFPALAYCAHGNPRILLKTISELDGFNNSVVSEFVKEYYRNEIWKEHTALGEKYAGFRPIVDWGREFIEKYVIPETRTKNSDIEKRGTNESTCFFWVHRNCPAEVDKALSLLCYAGLIQELDRAIRATRAELGTRYSLHLGTLLATYANPLQEVATIVEHLSIKRMTEYGANHSAYTGAELPDGLTDDLVSYHVVNEQLQRSISNLDLTPWQKERLTENGFSKIQDVLDAGENTLRENIYMVGEIRARKISRAAREAVLEYLLG